MTDELFRRYPKGNTRQLIDYNNVVTLSGQNQFLCIDRGVLAICRYLLNSRGSYRTTFYTSLDDSGYTIPDDTQWNWLENLIGEGNTQMADCEDIVTQLEGIKEAILASGGTASTANGGCGCVASGDTPIDEMGDVASEDIPTGEEFPPTFPDREAFDSYRCKAATYLVDGYINTLKNWAGLVGTTGGLTVAVIVGLTLLVIPPLGLSVVLTALGLLLITDLTLFGVLLSIAESVEASREDLICQVYNAETSGDARDIIAQAGTDAVTTIDPPLIDTFYTIVDNLISVDQCNVLLTQDGAVMAVTGEDCSTCGTALSFIGTPWTCSATITEGSLEANAYDLLSCFGTVTPFGVDTNSMWINTAIETNIKITLSDDLISGLGIDLIVGYSVDGIDQTPINYDTYAEMPKVWEVTHLVIIQAGPAENFTTQFKLSVIVEEP